MKVLCYFVGAALLLLVVAIALEPVHLHGAQSSTPMFTTSRYAMMSGTFSPSPGKSEDGVFKLDTYTGKTWKLTISMDGEGKRIDKWLPIEE
jgi:hypothetical protein